jgi:hypothetical protein
MPSDHQGQGSVQVLMDDRLAPSQARAPLGTLDLQDLVVKTHGVIPVNCALESWREGQLQVPVPARYECCTAP